MLAAKQIVSRELCKDPAEGVDEDAGYSPQANTF